MTSSKDIEQLLPDPYQNDKDSTAFCNSYFQSLSSVSFRYSFIWKQFKPLIVGYIYYTPVNDQTKKLMTEFRKIFDAYKNISDQLGLLAASKDEIYQTLKLLESGNVTNGSSVIMAAILDFISGNQTSNSSEFRGKFFFPNSDHHNFLMTSSNYLEIFCSIGRIFWCVAGGGEGWFSSFDCYLQNTTKKKQINGKQLNSDDFLNQIKWDDLVFFRAR